MPHADWAHALATHRAYLGQVAYRMLGSFSDAEDILQDAFERASHTPFASVVRPRAFLTTVVTRLCLDVLKSARVRREAYVGPWLPEPDVRWDAPSDAATPETAAMQTQVVSMALLHMLEALTPDERAVLVLHTLLDWPHADVAHALDKSPAACRQLLRRARQKLPADALEHTPSPAALDSIARFMAAAAAGDVPGMEAALAPDAVLLSDGGGIVQAARKPVHGASRVAAFTAGIVRKFGAQTTPVFGWVGGEPSAVGLTADGTVDYVVSYAAGAAGVTAVYVMRNPHKLAHVQPPTH